MVSQGIQPGKNIGMGQAGQVVMVFLRDSLARGRGESTIIITHIDRRQG